MPNLINVGTDATIHEHIKKIIERSYVIKTKDSRFHPTNLGLALVQGYDRVGLEESLTKPKLRALLEQHLSSICGGTMERTHVAPTLIHQFRTALRLTMEKIDILHDAIAACASNGILAPAPLDDTTGGNQNPSSRRRVSLPTNGRRRPGPEDGDDFEPGKPRNRPAESDPTAMDQEPLCSCDRPCKSNVVKKDGPNRGRRFWSCSDCNFFQWNHASQIPKDGGFTSSTSKSGPTMSHQVEPQIGDVRCNCGQLAVRRTVSKDGPNRGRQFYACAQAKENACQFFSWTDQSSSIGPKYSSYALQSYSNNNKFGHSIKCGCGMEAAREMTRGGANEGRSYYRCPKMVMRCGFFKWEDEEGAHAASNQCEESFAISCYRCGKEGHFANACVEQGTTDAGRFGGNSGRARRTSSSCRGRLWGRGGRRGGYSKRTHTLTAGTSKRKWDHSEGPVDTEEF